MPGKSIKSEFQKLDASTDEELDALEIDLTQDDGDDLRTDDGTGIVSDDLAQERIEELTEVGPDAGDRGVVNAAPGHDDTSKTLRRHNRSYEAERAEETAEASLDEPRDEEVGERIIDEDDVA